VVAGQRIGQGTVLDPEIRIDFPSKSVRGALLRCACGTTYKAALGALTERNGVINTTSCGCVQREVARELGAGSGPRVSASLLAKSSNPGMSRHPLWKTWRAILYRCENPKCRAYPNYGGRGIKVCERWHDFSLFAVDIEAEIGPKPGPEYSLDRADNNDGYGPGKVRWATAGQQSRNRRFPVGESGFRGVLADKGKGEDRGWIAKVHLGRFNTVEEAAAIYARAVEVLEREGVLT